MPLAIYIGDEVTAAGYRLAGVATRVPNAGEETAAFVRARREASIVLVSTALASRIGSKQLAAATRALSPLTVLVPDLLRETPLPAIAAQLRAELGLGN
jgi:vacuolar-type H+-ATPase subunit F/Vma7